MTQTRLALACCLAFAAAPAAVAAPDRAGAARVADAERSPAGKLWWCITHPGKCLSGTGAGGPPPPSPPPPPMPPPPPPPPVTICNPGPFIVFFDWDKDQVTPEAAAVLDSAIGAYMDCGAVPIMLAGYTDSSGRARYNLGLSERRNASVRAYLVGHGLPDTAIASHGYGETHPRVPTANGVREIQNRRVEITYGPPPDM